MRIWMKNTVLSKLRWIKPTPQKKGADRQSLAPLPVAISFKVDTLREAIQKIGIPRAPIDLPPVEEARFLLDAVCEIEHALLVEYLYAAYSIKRTGVPPATSQHRRQLIKTAVEEMGHLITAQNLLLSIGGAIYFNRDETALGKKPASNFPFPVRFEPLSLKSLSKYVTAESPSPAMINDLDLRVKLEPIFHMAEQEAGRTVNHVGILFVYLFWLFQPSDEPHPLWPELPGDLMPPGRHLADSDFSNVFADRQAMPAEFESPSANIFILPIQSRDDALLALDMIAQQGEGWKLSDDSHFRRLLDTFERFDAELANIIIAVPVDPNTSEGDDPAAERSRITHEAALRWAKLLNARYRLLLLELSLAMLQPRDNNDTSTLGRSSLLSASLNNEMRRGLMAIANRLTGLPLHPDSPPSEVAGPPFELPDGSFPTDVAGARLQIRDTLLEAKQLMNELEHLPAPNEPSNEDLELIGELRASDDLMLAEIGV
jgi:hypothetical protein